jgi:predicted metal-dependent HD superfamily phosphohydrolase
MSEKITNKANLELQQLKKDCLSRGVAIDNVFSNLSKILIGFYGKENRFYHNLNHVLAVVACCRKYAKNHKNFLEIILAAWFHDIIYAPRARNNEALSARLFERIFKRTNMQSSMILRVKNYIFVTQKHLANKDYDISILIDADLEILSAPWPKYLKYCLNIRKEYSHLAAKDFKYGRIKFLRNFLEQVRDSKIYQHLPETYNQKAINNIKKELKELTE